MITQLCQGAEHFSSHGLLSNIVCAPAESGVWVDDDECQVNLISQIRVTSLRALRGWEGRKFLSTSLGDGDADFTAMRHHAEPGASQVDYD